VNNPNTVNLSVSRKFAVISVIILLLIVAVGGIFLYYALDASAVSSPPKHLNLSTTFNLKNDVNLALNVTVRDPSGKVIASVYQPHDLITNNFYYLMLYPFLLSGYPSSWDVVNTAGTSESVCYTGCTTSLPLGNVATPPLLAIGSGTTAPAVTDYKLTTLVTNMPTPARPQTYYGSNSIILTVSSTTVLTTATTISEAGYEVELQDGNYVLIAHDTFTGVSVPAGGAITIAYQWTFGDPNQVWMVNYMDWMAAAVGAYTTCVGTSLNTCVNQYDADESMSTSGSASYNSPHYLSQGYTAFTLCVGTGTTAPAWTQYNLISQVGSCVATGTPAYSVGSNTAYISASISIPSSSTITEAGLEMSVPSGYIVLYLRSTFSGIVVSAGQSVTITIGYQV
jgi:hypothetical protein